MKIKDVMIRPARTLRPDDSLEFARSLFVWAGIRHAPVLDSDDLVGLVSDRDLAWYLAGHPEVDAARALVSDVMQTVVSTAGAETSLTEAAARMAERRLGCLPITERGKLVGIVTTTDVLAGEVQQSTSPPPTELTVSDVMTVSPIVTHGDDSLLSAARVMRRHRIRHLPVVDGDGRAIAMVSDRDVRQAVGDVDHGDVTSRLSQLRVVDVMSQPVITISEGTSIRIAAKRLSEFTISALPVVGNDDMLVGIVSYVDLMAGLVAAAR